MRQHHDMGGEKAGPVEKTEHDYAPWEKRVDALMVLLSDRERSLIKVDELRRNIEAIGPDAYHKMTYYERWITSITSTLLQRGALTSDELARKLADIERRETAGLL
ncbi:MAG: nitrile hydratase subunit beta [Alphaproteobacteria bacterium]|nr:nitrile hydratase subunit beta [Alphaproteobacteria bacterium]